MNISFQLTTHHLPYQSHLQWSPIPQGPSQSDQRVELFKISKCSFTNYIQIDMVKHWITLTFF